MVEKGCLFFVCINWELAVHAAGGEVTADSMGVALYDRLSIIIMSLSAIFLLGDSFGFRWCGLFTLFLMMQFGAVDFFHQFVYFHSEVLVF